MIRAFKEILAFTLLMLLLLTTFTVEGSGIRHARNIDAPFINMDFNSFIELYKNLTITLQRLGFNNIVKELNIYYTELIKGNASVYVSIFRNNIMKILTENTSIANIPRSTFIKLAVIVGCTPTKNGFILDPAYYIKILSIYHKARIMKALNELKSIDPELAKLIEKYNELVNAGKYSKALDLLLKDISSRIYHVLYEGFYNAFSLALEALNITNMPHVLVFLDRKTGLKLLETLLEEIRWLRENIVLDPKYYNELKSIERLVNELIASYSIYYYSQARDILKLLKSKVIGIITFMPEDLMRTLIMIMSIGLSDDNKIYVNLASSEVVKIYAELASITEIQSMIKAIELSSENRSSYLVIDPYLYNLHRLISSISDIPISNLLEITDLKYPKQIMPRFRRPIYPVETSKISLLTLIPLSITALYITYLVLAWFTRHRELKKILSTPIARPPIDARYFRSRGDELRVKTIKTFHNLLQELAERGYIKYKYETVREFINRLKSTEYYNLLIKAYNAYEVAAYSDRKVCLKDLRVVEKALEIIKVMRR